MIFPGTVEAMVLLYESNKMRLILTVQRNLGKKDSAARTSLVVLERLCPRNKTSSPSNVPTC